MAAEAIAKVVADLRSQRAQPARLRQPEDAELYAAALTIAGRGPVVDATAIYQSLVAKDEPVYVYEDHPCIAPPWDDASICFLNKHGNVIVLQMRAVEFTPERRDRVTAQAASLGTPENPMAGLEPDAPAPPWEPAGPTDWDRVRWVANTFVWCGGRSETRGGATPTIGPMHMWQFAIYDNGEPADLHWVHLLPENPMENWDTAHLVLLGALNFMNCRNVELVEPRRPRAVARRMERTGVRVHTINVFPTAKSSRSDGANEGMGVPLSSVRGHFSCYGPEYGRGLLFGKIAGRFWIPQHARGEKALGEGQSDYALHP